MCTLLAVYCQRRDNLTTRLTADITATASGEVTIDLYLSRSGFCLSVPYVCSSGLFGYLQSLFIWRREVILSKNDSFIGTGRRRLD